MGMGVVLAQARGQVLQQGTLMGAPHHQALPFDAEELTAQSLLPLNLAHDQNNNRLGADFVGSKLFGTSAILSRRIFLGGRVL